MKNEIAYLSGQMTGVPDLNYPKFEEAERRLRAAGFIVVNPHKIHPKPPVFKDKLEEWRWFMRNDIKALLDCNLIAVLNDWRFSPGSNFEVKVALAFGMPMMCAHTLQMLECDDASKMKRVPNKYIIKELTRELNMRKKHFPLWITSGKIRKQDADHRIEVIEQLLADAKDLKFIGGTTVQPVQSQGNLF